ncbi:FKBP-type peptidyl-prolyl cis-trans isomerase [Trypanosoma theileri]|uniref:peptidylprolyl isomerase n=1 Tax=Trypanosoma theileri TaxID=67003 RepID=A0A1X0P788_9TRYP|nr:FKBP-type peptidyl-prolyl cis-trans isomerase [Trypanosoma theileri]ORC92439.1 FKBP-type peptidyl-prolyl cis-trans isomerase [Trypanosoma theileri]
MSANSNSESNSDNDKDIKPQTCKESEEQKSNTNDSTTEEKDSPSSSSSLSSSSSSSNWIDYWMWYGAILLLLITISFSLYDKYHTRLELGYDHDEYIKYLKEEWSTAGNKLLAAAAHDKSFTNYRNTRIFFRPIMRKVPIPNTSPVAYKQKIGLAEVDNDNHWRSEYDNVKGESNKTTTGNKIRCIDEDDNIQVYVVGIRSNGIRFTSSYQSGVPPDFYKLENHVSCLQKVLLLMCEGDKWEMFCPPEEAYGEVGSGEVPPAATTVWRVSVQRTRGGEERTREDAERRLLRVAVEMNETLAVPVTRRRLFEKAKMYLANSTVNV